MRNLKRRTIQRIPQKPDMARHAARRVALQMLYADMLGGGDCESVLLEESDFQNVQDDQPFVDQALSGIAEKRAEFDVIISERSPKRALERIPALDRAILYLALHELSLGENPHSVIINEAVELAKRFGEDADGRFINGVLGAVVRDQAR